MPFVTIDNRHIHYDCPRALPSEVGYTVLLVHGALDDRRIWRHVYDALKAEHTPIALDLPAHGSSDWPVLEGAGEHVDFFTTLVNRLELDQVVFCGHSMGGSMALHYALEQPSRVAGLIPVGSSPEWKLDPANTDDWSNPDSAYETNLGYLFAKKTPKTLITEYDLALRETSPRTCRADLNTCLTFDLRDRLKNISAPTCVICGDEETWKDGSLAIHELVPNASYHEIANAGVNHRGPITPI